MTRHRPAPPPAVGLATSWQHQAAESLPNPLLLIGSAGNVESCNRAALLYFGLELTTRPYAELVAPESAELLGAAVAEVLRGESPADTRLNYHTTAGFQPMESRFYPYTENDRVRGCIVSSTVMPDGNAHDVATGDGGRVQHLLEGLADAFFTLDDECRFSYLNVQAQRLLGRPGTELLGRRLLEVFEEFGVESGPWLGALGSRTPGVFEAFYGPQRSWLEVHTYPTDAGLIVYLHDVTQRRGVQQALRRAHDELEERVRARTEELEAATKRLEALNVQLQHDAFHDALTGLPNRALLLDRLSQAVARNQRHRAQGFAVLFLDFDRFKVINDSLGHAVGDALLAALGKRLQDCVRPTDTVARLGGDEFTVLLTDVPVTAEAVRTAERIRVALEKPLQIGEHELSISASVGIVASELGYSSAEAVLRDADIAMYRAKLGGKAQHRLFGPAMRDEAVRRLDLETDLRAALIQGTLEVAYQPIVAIATGKLIGFEALARWPHPRYGDLEPGEFIPLAEEVGLITQLDRFVLRRACTQVRAWRRQFPGLPPLTLSANLSSRQFALPELAAWLEEILLEIDFDPRNLKLEITESVFMASSDEVLKTLRDLRDLGVQLHIDDFGTGYSSLSYLQNLPVSTLKIDRSFITQMGVSGDGELVQTIVAMAKALGLSVTAEGIETAAQLEQLKSLGCEYGQGYLYARPLSPAATEVFVAAQGGVGEV